jgi:hypothetical protein
MRKSFYKRMWIGKNYFIDYLCYPIPTIDKEDIIITHNKSNIFIMSNRYWTFKYYNN